MKERSVLFVASLTVPMRGRKSNSMDIAQRKEGILPIQKLRIC